MLRTHRALLAGVTLAILGAACAGPGGEQPPAAPPPPSSAPLESAPAPGTPTATPEPPPAESIRVRLTGDMLVGDAVQDRAAANADGAGFDFGPMLAPVAPLLRDADLSVCHQETAISVDNVGLDGFPLFNAPRELAAAQAAVGYDACSTASNHTVDLGLGGITSTLDALDSVGIEHTGSARSSEEQAAPAIYDVQGVRVGHLSYTYGLNGLTVPEPWSVNLIDPATIVADAARVRAAGADVVMVSLHFGEEQQTAPSADQEEVVAEVMDGSEVDLVVGHHAHVVQPVERLDDGDWVLYGLGNFLAQQDVSAANPTPPHRDGVIIEVTFGLDGDRYTVTEVGYVPTFYDASTGQVQVAPSFSRERTEAALLARGAPLVDLTP